MRSEDFSDIGEPRDYFQGRGHTAALPTPREVLVFVRRDRRSLQQKALQNRSHHRWVLMVNFRGAGQVHVDQRTVRLRPGEALVVQPFQFHHFTQVPAESLVWLFCTFELESGSYFDALRYRVIPVEGVVRAACDALVAAWRKAECADGGEGVAGTVLQAAVLTLLLELRGEVEGAAPRAGAGHESRLLERLNRLMESHARQPMTIPELAETLCMSPAALRSKFREVAGVSLGAYLRHHRMHRAMALLRTTDLPVGTVAAEAGYASASAFSRAFREATGRAPLEYRRGG